jgi:hypothetical protein
VGAIPLVAAALAVGLPAQTIELQPASAVQLPWPTDSNSPSHWWNNSFVLFDAMGTPYRNEGANQFTLGNQTEVILSSGGPYPLWIEATYVDDNGTLFAWYHHEPDGLCPATGLTAPQIGAMVSYDNGFTFQDLGFVLESGDPIDCNAQNGYFAGGNGDFSVIADASHTYFYFLYSNYGGDVSTQGVAVARMNFNDRFNPGGSVWKYYNGGFTEPGLGGRVTPTFPANVSWVSANADAFWGPSVHWNTALNQFVVLLNHSCCSPGWPQEGIYVSLNPDVGNPLGWSAPVKILDSDAWYPQVIGYGQDGTDKLAGWSSRLYVGGVSTYKFVVTYNPSQQGPVSDGTLPVRPH